MKIARNQAMSILLIFSLAFNIAFVGIWTYHFAYVRPRMAKLRQRPAPGEARPAALLRRLAKLDLNRTQKQRLRRDYVHLRRRLKDHMEPLKEARHEFLMLLQDPEANPQQLQAAQAAFARRQHRMQQAIFEHLLKVRQELTPPQRRAFGRMLYRAHGRLGGRAERLRRRPPKKQPKSTNQPRDKDADAF